MIAEDKPGPFGGVRAVGRRAGQPLVPAPVIEPWRVGRVTNTLAGRRGPGQPDRPRMSGLTSRSAKPTPRKPGSRAGAPASRLSRRRPRRLLDQPRRRDRRCRRASPGAEPRTAAAHPGDRAGCRARAPGTARPGRAARAASSSSSSVETRASACRSGPPAPKPLRYHETCLRNSLHPRSSPMCRLSSSAWRYIVVATSPSVGRVATGSPAKAAARSRNSHGRPRQPRPTTTPAAPVCSTIRSASAASQTSPLPSTGMSTCSTSSPMQSQSASPGVALDGGAPVQRDRGGARLLGDPAGVEVGQVVLVDAAPGLHRHRHVVRRGRRAPRRRGSRRAGCASTAAPPRRPCGSPWAPGSRS